MDMLEALLGNSREARDLKLKFLKTALVNDVDSGLVYGRAGGLLRAGSEPTLPRSPSKLYLKYLASNGSQEAN